MIEPEFTPNPNFSPVLGEDQTGVAAALIDRMARGDGGALTELYGMWSPILLGASVRMLGDRHEAQP